MRGSVRECGTMCGNVVPPCHASFSGTLHVLYMYEVSKKFWGHWGPTPWNGAWLTPYNVPLPTCYANVK